MVANSRAIMSKLVYGVIDDIVKECILTMLIKEIDISRLMVHGQ